MNQPETENANIKPQPPSVSGWKATIWLILCSLGIVANWYFTQNYSAVHEPQFKVLVSAMIFGSSIGVLISAFYVWLGAKFSRSPTTFKGQIYYSSIILLVCTLLVPLIELMIFSFSPKIDLSPLVPVLTFLCYFLLIYIQLKWTSIISKKKAVIVSSLSVLVLILLSAPFYYLDKLQFHVKPKFEPGYLNSRYLLFTPNSLDQIERAATRLKKSLDDEA